MKEKCGRISVNKFSLFNFILIVFLAGSLLAEPSIAQQTEPDAKSIPKPILMLGLYCNAADTVLKIVFEKNPSLTPWRAAGKREKSFAQVFAALDFNRMGAAKAVRDKALTENEIKFLDQTAVKDATNWGLVAHEKCVFETDGDLLDTCLRNLNSEIFKCYQQIRDKVETLSRAP